MRAILAAALIWGASVAMAAAQETVWAIEEPLPAPAPVFSVPAVPAVTYYPPVSVLYAPEPTPPVVLVPSPAVYLAPVAMVPGVPAPVLYTGPAVVGRDGFLYYPSYLRQRTRLRWHGHGTVTRTVIR